MSSTSYRGMTTDQIRDRLMIGIAHNLGSLAKCYRRKVGCVILDLDNRIIATGYNGVPRDLSHCDPDNRCEDDRCIAIHAEANALMHCPDILKIDTIYTSCSPCFECCKLIANTSCKRIVYLNKYKETSGFDLLGRKGIKIERIEI